MKVMHQAGQPTLQEGTPSNTHHRRRNSYIRESKAFYDEKFERKKIYYERSKKLDNDSYL